VSLDATSAENPESGKQAAQNNPNCSNLLIETMATLNFDFDDHVTSHP
jgi:hypothetical protein